jgi:hypothetical protein
MLPDSANSMDPKLPPHLQSAFFPELDSTKDEIGDLIGTTIHFLDGKSRMVMACTIQDCGTSRLRGDWVEVVYNETTEMRISPEEMKEILANRVQ